MILVLELIVVMYKKKENSRAMVQATLHRTVVGLQEDREQVCYGIVSYTQNCSE